MYWDAEQSTYLPAPNDDALEDDKAGDKKDDRREGKDKKEKVKVAKKIAKVITYKVNCISIPMTMAIILNWLIYQQYDES